MSIRCNLFSTTVLYSLKLYEYLVYVNFLGNKNVRKTHNIWIRIYTRAIVGTIQFHDV